MVTRKPVGPPVNTSQAAQSQARNANNPPYPATPIDSSKIPASVNSIYSPNLGDSPAFDLIDMDEARRRPRRDSDVSSHGTWDSDDDNAERKTTEDYDIPKPLRITPSKQKLDGVEYEGERHGEIPAALRPGPTGGQHSPRASLEQGQPQYQPYHEEAQSNPWAGEQQYDGNSRFESNNPYLRNQQTGGSQASWPEPAAPPPPPPMNAPPPPPAPSASSPIELPTAQTPSEELSKMSLHGQTEPKEQGPYQTAEILKVPHMGQAPLPPVTGHKDSIASTPNPWGDQSPTPEQKWDDTVPIVPPPGPPPGHEPRHEPGLDEPSLIDGAGPSTLPPTNEPPGYVKSVPAPISIAQQTAAARSTDSIPDTPGTRAKRQRNEFYQIKHVNWLDESESHNSGMRRSPILTQNANGPCPLLALVNALVLSTPQNMDTALIETLRSREQVSLGLLLDAVFDELMSGRRGETAHELPDVSELYSFLLALHTGMNVNPRFITPVSTPRGSLEGHPPGMGNVHPMHRAQSKAGCFEETREMRLYSTFNVPLIHGWVPSNDSPAYEACERSAPSFEDAQNIQFLESELEDKLRSEGLSGSEQQTLQDINTIKSFLNTWPTQLTDYGLQAISKTLRPGQIAILFRNDHFSTVYKEPKYGGLMTLVTDTGYSSHEEIVWESLVDVNGAACEMFSGDFRVVSHNQDARLNQGSSAGGEEGWQTVPSRNNHQPPPQYESTHGTNGASADSDEPPALPGPRPTSQAPDNTSGSRQVESHEQEDHDLALALQLQEEEEDRQRQSSSQRRREQELSEQFLSRENEGRPPAIPPRRGGGRQPSNPRVSRGPSARPPPADRPFDPDAPPTYEESSNDRRYQEPGSTANPTQGNPLSVYDALRRQQTDSSAGNRRQSVANRLGRRVSQPNVPGGYASGVPLVANAGQTGRRPQTGTVQEAEERCAVM